MAEIKGGLTGVCKNTQCMAILSDAIITMASHKGRTKKGEHHMKRSKEITISRREAIAAMGVMAASSQFAISEAAEAPKTKSAMALQLYTMRDPAKKDLPGTLKKLREIGWEYVQWSGMPSLPAEKIRKELDAAGLKAIAAHCSVESFETDFDNSVKFWKTVGSRFCAETRKTGSGPR